MRYLKIIVGFLLTFTLFSCFTKPDKFDSNSNIGFIEFTTLGDGIAIQGGNISIPFKLNAPTNTNGLDVSFNVIKGQSILKTSTLNSSIPAGDLSGFLEVNIPSDVLISSSEEVVIQMSSTSGSDVSVGVLNDDGVNFKNITFYFRAFCKDNLCPSYNAELISPSLGINEANNDDYDFSFDLTNKDPELNPFVWNSSSLWGQNFASLQDPGSFNPGDVPMPGILKFDEQFVIFDGYSAGDDYTNDTNGVPFITLTASFYDSTDDKFVLSYTYESGTFNFDVTTK